MTAPPRRSRVARAAVVAALTGAGALVAVPPAGARAGTAQTGAASAPAAPSPSPASPSPSPAASASPPAPPAITPGVAGLLPGRAAAVEREVLAALAELDVPGLSAAVVQGRELKWSAGYGVADLENAVPATPATVYRLASVSKPITAALVLQLVESGKIDLDAPIQRYVPSFPEKPWPVTARHLLCHQSGVRNWTQEEFFNTRRYRSVADAVAVFKDDPLLFEPGTRTQYTSFGFTLLGAIAEGAGGAPFLEQLRKAIFQPAGMETARDDDVLAIVPRRARGYQKRADGTILNAPLSDVSNRLPGGGLVATVEDMARFAAALQGGGLLKAETLRLAFTPQSLRGGRGTGFGLGWVLGRVRRRLEVYHTGSQPQTSTVLYMWPDAGAAVALAANVEGVETELLELARKVMPLVAVGSR